MGSLGSSGMCSRKRAPPELANVGAGGLRTGDNHAMASFRARTLYQSLDPADLAAAVQAFEASLHIVEDTMDGGSAYDLRHALARHVIEHALNGERDAAALRLRPSGIWS